MDIEDLITECNGPTAANTSDLSPGVVEAVERSDRDADDRYSRLVALMPARPDISRVLEIERQAKALKQESIDSAMECQHQYVWWLRYNHRYLRLHKQLQIAAQPLVLDTNDAARLQQITDLLALDTERAKAQAALTRLIRRDLEIFEEFKRGYLEWVEITGVDDADRMLWNIAKRVKRQYHITRWLGQRLHRHALESGDI